MKSQNAFFSLDLTWLAFRIELLLNDCSCELIILDSPIALDLASPDVEQRLTECCGNRRDGNWKSCSRTKCIHKNVNGKGTLEFLIPMPSLHAQGEGGGGRWEFLW